MFIEPEEYVVAYGLSPTSLNMTSDTVMSITDTSINFQPYELRLQGLMGATLYYFRVEARFGVGNLYFRHSDVFFFFTQFERK